MDLVESEIKRLSGLPNMKNKSEDYVRKRAMISLQKKSFDISKKFQDIKEIKEAKKIFDTYLEHYTFDNYVELTKLGDLTYSEILKARVEKKLNCGVSEDGKSFVSDKDVKILNDLTTKIDELRKDLGIIGEKEEKELSKLQMLEKLFEDYVNENREEFTITVPYNCHKCKFVGTEIYLLRHRVKEFDILKHPHFAGRWLFNYQILKDVKEGKLSKEDAWRYLSNMGKGKDSISAFSKKYCVDYIDWTLKNWDLITSFLPNYES